MPHLKSVTGFHGKFSNPAYISIYEFNSREEMKDALTSSESGAAKEGADLLVGALAKSFRYNTYSKVYP